MYTQQLKRQFREGPVVLAVKANGGTVTVEKAVGTDWVVANTYSTDGCYLLQLGTSETRFTPTGAAAFEIS